MSQEGRIYTRAGDDGTTGRADGRRVSKTSPRITANGMVDELNAQIGVVLASGVVADLIEPLQRVQRELLLLGADLSLPTAGTDAQPPPRIDAHHVEHFEQLIDKWTGQLAPLKNFILPGGTPAAAALHVARTICRRAERATVALAAEEPVTPFALKYLNRLSDMLFVMARFQNASAGVPDVLWPG
ncbi:MAG: cob(I)yrinic acid a,c-diamide adenosyltransferase [Planctomycetota bacterium]